MLALTDAILSNRIIGTLKTVLCSSATLSSAKKAYSQHERESLAVLYALRKFHKYIHGKSITVFTDSQPVKSIFSTVLFRELSHHECNDDVFSQVCTT